MSKLRTYYTKNDSYTLYMGRIKDTFDRIRASNRGLDYVPTQYSGLEGQRAVLQEKAVIVNIDFENNE